MLPMASVSLGPYAAFAVIAVLVGLCGLARVLDAPLTIYNQAILTPVFGCGEKVVINLAPNTTFLKGQVLGFATASANDVQTITDSSSGGSFAVKVEYPVGNIVQSVAIAHGASAATVQAAITGCGNVGIGQLTATGSAGGPYACTFGGTLANMPIPVMTIDNTLATGGTAAVAHTTTGITGGQYGKYDSSLLTAPAAAPTVAGNGTGSAFGAGTYTTQYTLVNALGESLPSPAVETTITAAQNLRVSAISSLNAAVTKVRYYVNSALMAETVPSSGTAAQTDITGSAITLVGDPPGASTVYAIPNGNGTQIAAVFLPFDCVTDAAGAVTLASDATNGGYWGDKLRNVWAYSGGAFLVADLVGFDAKAAKDLGGHYESPTVYRF